MSYHSIFLIKSLCIHSHSQHYESHRSLEELLALLPLLALVPWFDYQLSAAEFVQEYCHYSANVNLIGVSSDIEVQVS